MKSVLSKNVLMLSVAASVLFSGKAFAIVLANGSTSIVNCEAPGVICHPNAPTLDTGIPPKVAGASATISQSSLVKPVVKLAIIIPGMLPNTTYRFKLQDCSIPAVTSDSLGVLKLASTQIRCINPVAATSSYLQVYLGASTKVLRRSKGAKGPW
jgi:hypothetical protein